MATINSRDLIEDLIANDGYFEDDPRVDRIVQYVNQYGQVAWGVVWSNELPSCRSRYEEETEYIRYPRVIWRASDHKSN